MQKVEQKEREDDKAGAKIVAKTSGKGGGGRGAMKQKKLITEMLPSPMAERVVPVIDDAYKKKEPAAKKAVSFSSLFALVTICCVSVAGHWVKTSWHKGPPQKP